MQNDDIASGKDQSFDQWSKAADDTSPDHQGMNGKTEAHSELKSVGVDPDKMAEAASERATAFQEMVIAEIRSRPMQALGWAVGAGFALGLWSAR